MTLEDLVSSPSFLGLKICVANFVQGDWWINDKLVVYLSLKIHMSTLDMNRDK